MLDCLHQSLPQTPLPPQEMNPEISTVSIDDFNVYQIDTEGKAQYIGELRALLALHWDFQAHHFPKIMLKGNGRDGFYEDSYPWFLQDCKPEGYLGREFARQNTWMNIGGNPNDWSDLMTMQFLSEAGWNLPGNFLIGETARHIFKVVSRDVSIINENYPNPLYPIQATDLLTRDSAHKPPPPPQGSREELMNIIIQMAHSKPGESSAGGEQPKFATAVLDPETKKPKHVIVKFSGQMDDLNPVSQRWSDLLHAEHTANEVLRKHGYSTAKTQVYHNIQGRTFLESERFDRIGRIGRIGLVSLNSLYTAHCDEEVETWGEAAINLHTAGLISAEDKDTIIDFYAFGMLIANDDMHFRNLRFFLPTIEGEQFRLAPLYDMLPMHFRALPSGDVVNSGYYLPPPRPWEKKARSHMFLKAEEYWKQVAQNQLIPLEFRRTCLSTWNSISDQHESHRRALPNE